MCTDTLRIPSLGRLEPGKTADIVLLEENPLEDIEAVGKGRYVVREGRLLWDEGNGGCA